MKKTLAGILLFIALGYANFGLSQEKYDYTGQVGLNAAIFRGPEAEKYPFKVEGTQYAYSEEFGLGRVLYNNVEYGNLLLNLSINKDELHLKIKESGIVMELDKRLVEDFTIGERKFVKVGQESGIGGIPDGYYEVLYSKKDLLLKKSTKRINVRKHEGKGIYREYEKVDRYYAVKDGVAVQITKRGDFAKLYEERKKEIKDFIRETKDMYPGEENRERFFISIMGVADKK